MIHRAAERINVTVLKELRILFEMRVFLGLWLIIVSAAAANADTITSKANHLLNRLAFGARPGEVEELAVKGEDGLRQWVEAQLHPESIPDADLDYKLTQLPVLSMSTGQLHLFFPKPKELKKESQEIQSDRRPGHMLQQMYAQKFLRAVESHRQLKEVLVNFWFNHFNVSFQKGPVKWNLISYERDVIRPHVFGKFRDLLGAVAKSPAMLFYLDNHLSVRNGFVPRNGKVNPEAPKGLNENYARELLELHTVGVDGGYSQNDVTEVARAFTGWTVLEPQKETAFQFRPNTHDTGAKHIMSLTLNEGGGQEDGEKVLNYLSELPATAHFIAKKLAIKFIQDNPPESAVKKLAQVFMSTHGDLGAVYAQLFRLPEFWSEAARRSKIKTPFEYVVAATRAVGGVVPIQNIQAKYRTQHLLGEMGEAPYECQPPTGYKATSEFWVNPGALVTRINFGLALGANRLPEVNFERSDWQRRLNEAQAHTPERVLDLLNLWILHGDMRTETRKRLVAELKGEPEVIAEPLGTVAAAAKPVQAVNLQKLVGLIIGSPEFQRR